MNVTYDLPDGSLMPYFLIGFVLIVLVFWAITLVEIVKHEYSGNNKIIWLGLVILMPMLGMILYYCFGRQHILGTRVRTNNFRSSSDEFV